MFNLWIRPRSLGAVAVGGALIGMMISYLMSGAACVLSAVATGQGAYPFGLVMLGGAAGGTIGSLIAHAVRTFTARRRDSSQTFLATFTVSALTAVLAGMLLLFFMVHQGGVPAAENPAAKPAMLLGWMVGWFASGLWISILALLIEDARPTT